jgi:hypothetical protein
MLSFISGTHSVSLSLRSRTRLLDLTRHIHLACAVTNFCFFFFLLGPVAGFGITVALNNVNPLVASLWGIIVWREMKGASILTCFLVALMLAGYMGAVVLLALSFLL